MSKKITKFCEIHRLVSEARSRGARVVHCHGVFDLLHPGHIRHLNAAKAQGDLLVVTLTADRFVNKGPGRPAFPEQLRAEQVASLSCVDYVALNEAPDAIPAIEAVRPNLYVKGKEYADAEKDITGKIRQETEAVERVGGKVHFTDDLVFSSSKLINHFFDDDAHRIEPFIEQLKQAFSAAEVLQRLEELADLRVLVVGDAILDEYQYVDPLGQSGKGVHLAAALLEKETFLGGSLIVANHLASFAKEVTLLTGVGAGDEIQGLASNVVTEFIPLKEDIPTLTKRRYVLRDGAAISKLFETYSSNCPLLGAPQTAQVISFLEKHAKNFDLVVVSDFGNGFTNPPIIGAIAAQAPYLALNTQTNSGNRGFHAVTQYPRADFISLNEPELRLAAHDRRSSLATVVEDVYTVMRAPHISVTRGVNGVALFEKGAPGLNLPALTMRSVDRVGAGDSYFALASLAFVKGYAPILAGFFGSVAAAIDVQIVGNREAVGKVEMGKYITRLMK